MGDGLRDGRRLRVVVAEDQPHVRAALAELVAEEGFELAGVATTGEEAVALCERARPDVAVVDVKMPSGGAAMIREIRSGAPSTAVVVLSAYDDDGARRAMRRAGANAYIVKGGAVEDLVAAIRRAAEAG